MSLRSAFSFLLFLALHVFLPISASMVTDPTDIAALAAVKEALLPSSIPPSSCLATWDFSASDPCSNPRRTHFLCGVACVVPIPGGTARVSAVMLEDAGYAGPLSPAVGNLSYLTHLDLSGNSFHGQLPASLGGLRQLRTLSFAFNAFSGEIPRTFGQLRALQSLDLSHNQLSGPVPAALARVRTLRNVDLSYNQLSGGLPVALPPSLVALALRGNAISGPILRGSFTGLRRLEVVEMAANQISGVLEGWFLRMPALQQVDLANNSLSGFTFGDPVVEDDNMGNRLVALDLGYNRIEGKLPTELGRFPALASLNLRHNRFRGKIPSEYAGDKAGNPLRRLFLDGNFLNGKVPEGLLSSASVTGRLGDNCLEGCPDGEELCQPLQKPSDVCREA